MPKRPHVLLLMCDQMQAHRLGFVDGLSHTPNLDRLAREGVHFRNAYTTQGQCVPSRAVMQTGLYAHECGVMINYGFKAYEPAEPRHENRLGPQHTTIGHAFRDQGYRTVYFGKSHLGIPLDRLGYDTHWHADGRPVSDAEVAALGIEAVPKSLRDQYQAAAKAVDWLRDYEPDDTSLFFTFSTNLPHPPFFDDPEFADLWDPADLPVPASFHEETFATKPPYQRAHIEDGAHGVDGPDNVRTMLRQYLTMIAAMDKHFGQVIAEFERLGIWDDTVVMVTADHGDMMGAHRMFKKGTIPYDELYRIPLLLKLPRGRSVVRPVVDDLVSNERFAATLLRLAGLDVPASFRHGDLVDTIERTEPAPEKDQRVFFEHYAAYWGHHPFYGVVTPRWKFVHYYGPDATDELYDRQADPHELTNLADRPEAADTRARLADQADRWWRATDGRDFAYYNSPAFRANRHNAWPDRDPSWDC